MSDQSHYDRMREAEMFFSKAYPATVKSAKEHFFAGRLDACEEALSVLPTKEKLLDELMERLRGKRVYKFFQKVTEGKIKDKSLYLKGLFSLGTHVAIEVEQGKSEYRVLLPFVYEKIGDVLYGK